MTRRRPMIAIVVALLIGLLPSYVTAQGSGPYTVQQTVGRGLVRSVAWSPAGDTIAVGGALGIWLYTPGFEDAGLLTGHSKAVYDLAFSPDGTRLASASHDMTVRVWDVPAQAEMVTLNGHTDLVVAVTWSPAGEVIASGSYDGTIRVWNPAAGEALHVLDAGGGWVDDLAFGPDGVTLASATRDGVLRLWDAASGGLIAAADAHPGGASGVTWSPDGSRIASSGRDGRVRVWDRTLTPLLTVDAHDDVIYDLAWNPHGDTIATAGWDGRVGVWSGFDGGARHVLRGTGQRVHKLAWSPDGTHVAALGWDDTVRLWDVAAGHAIAGQPEHMDVITRLDWHGDELRVTTLDGRLLVWCVPPGVWLWGDVAPADPAGPVAAAANADGTRAYEIDTGGVVHITDTSGGEAAVIATLPGRANAAAWSPDGTQLAVAARNGTVVIWGEQ